MRAVSMDTFNLIDGNVKCHSCAFIRNLIKCGKLITSVYEIYKSKDWYFDNCKKFRFFSVKIVICKSIC